MRKENLSCIETAERFGTSHQRVYDWERIYLEESPEGLYIERRGRASAGRTHKLSKEKEEDLIAENQRLRAENAYLKNLQGVTDVTEFSLFGEKLYLSPILDLCSSDLAQLHNLRLACSQNGDLYAG